MYTQLVHYWKFPLTFKKKKGEYLHNLNKTKGARRGELCISKRSCLNLDAGSSTSAQARRGFWEFFSRISQTISEHQHTEQVDDASRSRLERWLTFSCWSASTVLGHACSRCHGPRRKKKKEFFIFFIPSVYSRCMTRFCFNDAESSEEKAVCQQKIHRYIFSFSLR